MKKIDILKVVQIVLQILSIIAFTIYFVMDTNGIPNYKVFYVMGMVLLVISSIIILINSFLKKHKENVQ